MNEELGEFLTWSAIDLINEHRSLAVIRSYSRTLPLGGLGFGYMIGPSWLVEGLFSVALPYHIDTIRQAVGLVLVSWSEEVARRVADPVSERDRIVSTLDSMCVEVFSSEAEFVTFRLPTSTDVGSSLARQVALADEDAERSPASWLKFTVGPKSMNDAFLHAVAGVLDVQRFEIEQPSKVLTN